MSSIVLRSNGHTSFDWLYGGESVTFSEENIGILVPGRTIYGDVIVTNYRIRFIYQNKLLYEVPLGYVWKVEETTNTMESLNKELYEVTINCKDVRMLKLFFNTSQRSSRKNFIHNISKALQPSIIELSHFAFSYREKFKNNGWNTYDPLKEFDRLGIPNQSWSISDLNRNYSICETYPSILCLPRDAVNKGNEYIKSISEGRVNGRLPVLSWYDKIKKSAILRSSEPCTFNKNEKERDEEYLDFVIAANENSYKLPILDLRTFVNAEASQLHGGGYEAAYNNCPLEFLNLSNIHITRDSFRKLSNVCFPVCHQKEWLKILADTKWLFNIQLILNASTRVIVEISEKQNSVLIHCNDGIDRTTQVVSLAILMLDPYYRTMRGFITLIEKEWISFGHPFNIRNGNERNKELDYSPTFLQWIDCVWQVYTYLPSSFEFNEKFLMTIIDESLTNKFGNFITNNEKERNMNNIKKNTNSLWSYILDNINKFENPLYNPKLDMNPIIKPSYHVKHPKLWVQYYLRHNYERFLRTNKYIETELLDNSMERRNIIIEKLSALS
uniref:Myotubularin phosphatase domain-containing protein n=1 Tax=Parastrongyloides trichosuri TaxID=131310 RepID=A0A0N4ZP14_PARTI